METTVFNKTVEVAICQVFAKYEFALSSLKSAKQRQNKLHTIPITASEVVSITTRTFLRRIIPWLIWRKRRIIHILSDNTHEWYYSTYSIYSITYTILSVYSIIWSIVVTTKDYILYYIGMQSAQVSRMLRLPSRNSREYRSMRCYALGSSPQPQEARMNLPLVGIPWRHCPLF